MNDRPKLIKKTNQNMSTKFFILSKILGYIFYQKLNEKNTKNLC